MPFSFCKKWITLAIILVSPILYAKDLGTVGQVYPIQEEDFLQFIVKRLKTMQQTGEWERLQNQFSDNVKKHAERPNSVVNISKTLSTKSWNDDPSITVPYDLKDREGRIFASAGSTVNPLNYISIHTSLVFFDGDDTKQVIWAKQLNKKLSGKTKLILVNGSVLDQVKDINQPIYFDQEGRLTTRFHIQHVPAVVMQDGLHLKITEVAI
jgi:conjugal transfer pilus assembly protein TraW